MGFIRGVGIVIISVILFLSLLAGGTAIVVGQSLKYENVQPTIVNVSQEIITGTINLEKIIQPLIPVMQLYCQQNNTDYIFNQEGYTFVIPCDKINKGPKEITNHLLTNSISEIVEGIYYKDYNCTFTQCFKTEEIPLFVISEKAKNFWISTFYKILLAILISIALIILLAERKSNAFIISGTLFILTSFIVGKLHLIGTKIANTFLSSVASVVSGTSSKKIISEIVGLFFISSTTIFWWMLGIGIILIGIGIFLKLTNFGMKISNLFNPKVTKDEVKEIVKEETVKQKNKK